MARGLAAAVGIGLVALATAVVRDPGRNDPVPAKLPQAAAGYGALPLSFEPSLGGAFVARSGGATVSLERGGAVLGTTEGRLRLRPAGRPARPDPAGDDRLPGIVNRIVGRDPAKWRTNIPTFESVRYGRVWPGIDLRFHGKAGRLEYDFDVAPGADPGRIRLAVTGQRAARLSSGGDIVLDLGAGTVRLLRPIAYQTGPAGRTIVPSRQFLGSDGLVRFTVGDYDRGRPLVIDPVIVSSTFLGGADLDKAKGVAVDPQGNAYVTGSSFVASSDAFVTKLNEAGDQVEFTTYFGGSAFEEGRGIAVDDIGRAYVVGATDSTNFPKTTGVVQETSGGSRDTFVVRLAIAGGVQYATYHGGSGFDDGYAIAIDGSGNAYVTGDTDSSNFPTVTPRQASRAGDQDAFVTKFNSSLSTRIYSTYHGGSGSGTAESGRGIAVDADGGAYVTGRTDSLTFPLVNPVQADGPTSFYDAFVSRFNNGGTVLTFSTFLGGDDVDTGVAIALDGSGAAYVTGRTQSDDFPLASPAQAQRGGAGDVFVTKLPPGGGPLVYSTFLGGSSSDEARGIAVDASGSATVAGYTVANDFPVLRALRTERIGAYEDAIVAKLNPAGSAFVYSTLLGGDHYDIANAIAVDAAGAAYVAGETESPDFPTAGAPDPTFAGTYADAFVTKIDDSDTQAPDTIVQTGPPSSTGARDATFTFTSSEPDGARYECRMDNGSFRACTSPATYEDLQPGTRVFDVRSTDRSQNLDASPAAYSWRVDLTPPVAQIAASTTSAVAGQEVSFDAAASSDPDGGRVVRYEFDFDGDGLFETDANEQPRAAHTFKAGDFKVSVRVTDEVGLKGVASVELTATAAPSKPSTTKKPGASSDKSRVRFVLNGAFLPPPGFSAALVCNGEVLAVLRAKKRRVDFKRRKLDKTCRYTAVFSVKRKKLRGAKTVTISARFFGNDYLAPSDATYKAKVPKKKK